MPLHEYLTKHPSYLVSRLEIDKGNERVLAKKTDPVFLNVHGKLLTEGGYLTCSGCCKSESWQGNLALE